MIGPQIAHAGLTFTEKVVYTSAAAVIIVFGLWLIWWIRKNTR